MNSLKISKTQWQEAHNKYLNEHSKGEYVESNNMTLCRYTVDQLMNIPAHKHDYEQVVYVLKGEMTLIINNVPIEMKPGDVQVVRGGEEHATKMTKVPFQSIEIYSPARSDIS